MTMKTDDFAYIVETKKSFDDAVVSVLKAVEQKGWALFQIYDVKERLAAKGFEQKPLKSLCMPCKINVLEENGKVKIAGMKPTMVSQFFSEVSTEEAEEAEKDVIEIVNNAR
jgi:uncharacterized protein (DUF302 family)